MPRAPRALIPLLSLVALLSLLLRRVGGRHGIEPSIVPTLASRGLRRASRPPLSPMPVAPRVVAPAAPAWLEPAGATAPAGYPVKAKLGSGIFHEPGGAHYDRTHPDRWYASAAAATADGLRPARR